LDWDEEFALQDFLKSDPAERISWEQDGRWDGRAEETADRLTDRGGEEEERWTVVDTAAGGGGEVRDASTPLSAVDVEAQTGQRAEGEGPGI